MVGLKLDRTALESELASLIGHPPIGPIKFEDTIDLTTGMAKEWWILVQLLVRRLREADSISKHDVMAGALSQSILRGLLFAARHNYSHELLGTAASGKESMAVRQAIEFMRENASQPITAQDIASHANVGVRALQMGFQKELELTPSMYLQELRLQHVRDDLVASESGLETVAAIAAKWGFAHAGRFATTYFERFEEHPSETLKLRQPRY